MEKTYVLIKQFPFEIDNPTIYCKERVDEIEGCKSEKTKEEKFFAWLCLQELFLNYIHVDLSSKNPRKLSSGKWAVDDYYISISHSKNLVAVAVAESPIGIDIQLKKEIDNKTFSFFYNSSDHKYSSHPIELFSIKEAIFKTKNEQSFNPKNISSREFVGMVFDVKNEFDSYCLAIHYPKNVNIIRDENLKIKLNIL